MIDKKKPKNTGTRILFRHPLLEKLSRTHISIPITLFLLYASVLLLWSIRTTSLSGLTTASLFLLGMIFFTWVEYHTHRHLFHMNPNHELKAKWQYTMHGVHHEFPKDRDRLAMPPLLSVTIASVFLLLFRVILGDLAFSFLPRFLVGYATYLSIHYMVHAHQPPKNFLKKLWINHSIHHYKNGECRFGVTSPFWDYVYGTREKSMAQTHIGNGVESNRATAKNILSLEH